jgi:heterodisulfide reductase subunit A-like polyferredoxin
MAQPQDVVGAALVVGGGIAGVQASLDLAESGYKVYLVESETGIGGRMAQHFQLMTAPHVYFHPSW